MYKNFHFHCLQTDVDYFITLLFHGLAQSTVSTSEGTMVGKRDKLFI